MGIEPTWPAWKAGALPLSYTRVTEIILPAGLGLSITGLAVFTTALIGATWRVPKHGKPPCGAATR